MGCTPRNGTEISTSILWKIRLPRTVLVALTGAAVGWKRRYLSRVCSATRWLTIPDRHRLGRGAGRGHAMSANGRIRFGGSWQSQWRHSVAALLTVFIVYSLARVGQTIPTTNLILVGSPSHLLLHRLHHFLMIRSTSEVRRALAGFSAAPPKITGLPSLPCFLISSSVSVF